MASAFADAIFVAAAKNLLGLVQLCEGLAEDVVSDLILKDVELLEDRLVERASSLRLGLPVELVRILQQLQCGLEQSRSDLESVISLFKLFAEPGPLPSDAG